MIILFIISVSSFWVTLRPDVFDLGTDLAWCASAVLRPHGAIPPGFTPFGGWVYYPAPEAPLIRGMPTEP